MTMPNKPEPSMDSKIDEMLDGFFIMRSASPDDDLELLKARNQSGEPKHELKAQIKQLIADECSLERKRHVLIEGGLRQELNEIKNAIRVLAALQGEGQNRVMREIRYRAWHTVKGKMYSWEYIKNTYTIHALSDENVVQLKFMQYTGRKDKNGVEIYEGDVVTGFSGNGVVKWFDELHWDGGGSKHPGFWCAEWCEYKDEGALSYHDGFGDCEVIGNIYENPELLEAKP